MRWPHAVSQPHARFAPAVLRRFYQILHIKGRNFSNVFMRSRLPMTPMYHEKLHENRPTCFKKIVKTDTQTDRQTDEASLYI